MRPSKSSQPSARARNIQHQIWEVIARLKVGLDQSELEQLVRKKARDIERTGPAEWLNERDVVNLYPFFSLKWLQTMRSAGGGPAYHKIGSHRNAKVLYKRSDIEAFLETHRVMHE